MTHVNSNVIPKALVQNLVYIGLHALNSSYSITFDPVVYLQNVGVKLNNSKPILLHSKYKYIIWPKHSTLHCFLLCKNIKHLTYPNWCKYNSTFNCDIMILFFISFAFCNTKAVGIFLLVSLFITVISAWVTVHWQFSLLGSEGGSLALYH